MPSESIPTVRKNGSFVYEQFLPTDGFDIKVYTCGPAYAYAEARRSPTLGLKVQRDQDAMEVRIPVNLKQDEKMIAKKITKAFG